MTRLRAIFDYVGKSLRLEEVERELADPDSWSDREKTTALTRERNVLQTVVQRLGSLSESFDDHRELLELAAADDDADTVNEIALDLDGFEQSIRQLELDRMFTNEADPHDAYIDINAGEGGTESQDWANMLLRMYLRWAERKGYRKEILHLSPGDVAGIKSASVHVRGDHAYGWLRTETGVHRLVRKSPFNSGNRRHTSFASVAVTAEVDDQISIDVNPSDVRTDTYRASGAGGQHVNKTDSAIRLTHVPTGVVVQCQSERSQHRNREQAWRQLRSKLYEIELDRQKQERQEVEDSKPHIGFGSQIRSYVLDQSRVKDLRTSVERSDPNNVLDGDLDGFMEASLKAGE